MSALRELLAKFDVEVSGVEKLDALDAKLGKMGAALGAGVLLNGLKNIVTGLVEQGSALNDTSQKLGINVQDLQDWQFAAKLNGVEAESFNGSLTKLEKAMADNSKAGAESGGVFQKLGVALRDSHGQLRDTTEVLYDTGLAIAKLPPGADQTAAAMEAFGKTGAQLVPLFKDGEEGLKKYLGEVEKLGGGFSEDAIGQLDDLGDQMDRFDMSVTSAKVKLFSAFVPAMTLALTKVTEFVVNLTKSKEGMAALSVGLLSIAAVAVVVGVSMLAPFLPLAALLIGIVLILDDFRAGLEGNKSLIGEFLDAVGGKGTGDAFFKGLRDTLKEIADFAKEVLASIKNIKETINDVKTGKLTNQINQDIKKVFNAQNDEEKKIETLGESADDMREKKRLQAHQRALQLSFKGAGDVGEGLLFPQKETVGDYGTAGNFVQNKLISGMAEQIATLRELREQGTGLEGGSAGNLQQQMANAMSDNADISKQAFDAMRDELISLKQEQANGTLGDLSAGAGGGAANQPTEVTMTNSITNQITIEGSADKDDVVDGVNGAMGAHLNSAARVLKGSAP